MYSTKCEHADAEDVMALLRDYHAAIALGEPGETAQIAE
jgi:hypothetical protein